MKRFAFSPFFILSDDVLATTMATHTDFYYECVIEDLFSNDELQQLTVKVLPKSIEFTYCLKNSLVVAGLFCECNRGVTRSLAVAL